VAGEPLAAFEAFTAAADHLAFLGFPGVDDLVAQVPAVRALHAVRRSAWSARRRMPATFSPSCAANSSPSRSDGPIEKRCSTIAAPTAASSGAPKKVVAP